MADTIVQALLPIIVVLLIGYAAAWRHQFPDNQASIINHMVMGYAFPLSLFVGIVATPVDALENQIGLATSVFLGMTLSFIIAYTVCRRVFHREVAASTLQSLGVSAAAVPFVGSSLLPGLMPPASATAAISAAGFAMTLVQTPVALVLLSRATNAAQKSGIGTAIRNAVTDPVVWAPALAIVLVIADIHVPVAITKSLNLLGQATAGVALFASGIVLYSYRVKLSLPVVITVFIRNIVVPLVAWGVLALFGVSADVVRQTVLTLSIPIGSIVIILAVRYGVNEQESASSLFFSTLLSVVTVACFIAFGPQAG